MLVAMLPHGPVELAAYSLALALYLQRTPPSAPRSPHGRGCLRERGAARARRRARDLGEPMSAGRMFAALAVIAAGMLAAGLLISEPPGRCTTTGYPQPAPSLRQPGPAAAPTHQVRHGPTPRHAPVTRRRRAPRHARPTRHPHSGTRRSWSVSGLARSAQAGCSGRRTEGRPGRGLEIAAGVALIAMLGALLVLRRVRRRSRRRYELYELHLSTHDQAKPQDLEDMVESIANIVRAFPAERVRDGQPYVALELICGAGAGRAWSGRSTCAASPGPSARSTRAISAAYPDVRLGRRPRRAPRPAPGRCAMPGYVMRFRKERSFVYPLLAAGEELASPPLEQIARAQVALGEPSIVRFQLTPTAVVLRGARAPRVPPPREQARRASEHWGLPDGGLCSTLNRAEMRNAERTQNRSLFWLETVDRRRQRAGVQDGRRRRAIPPRGEPPSPPLDDRPPAPIPPPVPAALGPLHPVHCARLVSAAEVAHLLELPSARMKGVPVRRLTLPRIPAPPEACAAQAPPTTAPARTRRSSVRRRSSARRAPVEKPTQRPPPEDLYPVLRAENAQVAIHPTTASTARCWPAARAAGKTAALLALLPQRLGTPTPRPS